MQIFAIGWSGFDVNRIGSFVGEETSKRIRVGFVIGILVLSGIVHVLLPVAAVQWWQRPFLGVLLDPNLVINDTSADDWAGQQVSPPLGYPERVTAVNDQPVTSQSHLAEMLSDYVPGVEVTLTVAQPSNSRVQADAQRPLTRIVPITLTTFSPADRWNQFWLLYLTGLFTLGIGILTFMLRPQAEAAQVFALLTAFGAIAISGLFDLVTTQWLVRLWVVATPLSAVWIFWLAGVFPYQTRLFNQWPRIKLLLPLIGVGIAIWGQLWLRLAGDPWAYALPWRYAYLLNGIAALGGLGIMAYRMVQSPSPLVRQQGMLTLVGAFLAFAPLTAFNLLAGTGDAPAWLTPALYMPPLIIFPLTIGYTILRYRLLNMKIVLRRGLTYLLLTAVLAVAFSLLLSSLTMTVGGWIDVTNPVLLLVYLLVVALVFEPLRNRVQQAVDQYFFRQPVSYDDLLRAFNRELTSAVAADQVAACLLKYSDAAIPDVQTALYLPDEKVQGFASYANGQNLVIDAESPLVGFLRREVNPVDLSEERAWPVALRENADLVRELEAAVLVPMNNGDTLLGWLSLPPKANDSHYTDSELTFLRALADQSLIGLERAIAMRRLQSRVDELNMLSQFSQVLNITINLDDLLELVYTNYHRLLGVDNFFVALRDPDVDRLYMAFYVVDDERFPQHEGRQQPVTDARVLQAVNTGQPYFGDDLDGRFWVIAPLNAGAETLGAVYTSYGGSSQEFRRRHHQFFMVFADRTAVAIDRLQTRSQLEGRAHQLQIINEINLSLASTLELEPLLELILDKAIALLDTEAGTFMLTLPDTGELEFRVVRGPASDHLLGNRLPIGTGLAGTVAQTGRPVLVNQVQDDTRWFNQVDAKTTFESQSIMTVPLLRSNRVLGVLQVINKRSGAPFDEDDESLLMAFASQAVVALENARLLVQTDEELQKRVNELSMLQQLDRDLNTTLELDRVLNLTLDWALRMCAGHAGAIVLCRDAAERPFLAAVRGYDEDFEIVDDGQDKIENGLVGRVLAEGQAIVSNNVHMEPAYVAAAFDTHSQMTLPIVHKQQLLGAIAIESNELEAFDDTAVETATRVTNHAAGAIANALLYEQVHQANVAKSEFVSMVSHELKTPMTSMRGYTDLLLSGMTGELTTQQRGFLETIAANVRRMSRQIQDLTDISRIETGRLRVEPLPIAFTNVVSETILSVQAMYDEKGTQLDLNLPTDLPLVLADKSRMVQVLTNLLSNACKYSPEKSEVKLSFYADEMVLNGRDVAQPVVVGVVKDQGYGISAEDQKQLFTKFFRANDPNIRKATGTGLGLSITRGIVELHGGKLWVESALNDGSEFCFAIPQVVE